MLTDLLQIQLLQTELLQTELVQFYLTVIFPNAAIASLVIGLWPLIVGGVLKDKSMQAYIGFAQCLCWGSVFCAIPAIYLAVYYGRKIAWQVYSANLSSDA